MKKPGHKPGFFISKFKKRINIKRMDDSSPSQKKKSKKISPLRPQNLGLLESSQIEEAAQILYSEGVLGLPTETVYGLAGKIDSEVAIRKIFSTKERPFFDPLIVHVSSLKQAKELVLNWGDLTDFLARMLWPGPVTLILKKSTQVSDIITSGLDSVGIRMPKHPLALELIDLTGPLAAPSANRFGHTSPSCAQHVLQEFDNQVYVLDGGPCEIGIESTVIEIDELNRKLYILRPGMLNKSDLIKTLSKWSHKVQITERMNHRSPGHLEHHYMPEIPLLLASKNDSIDSTFFKKKDSLLENTKLKGLTQPRVYTLILSSDANQAARELYSKLREAKPSEFDLIVYQVSDEQIKDLSWSGILDRLWRAAQIRSIHSIQSI